MGLFSKEKEKKDAIVLADNKEKKATEEFMDFGALKTEESKRERLAQLKKLKADLHMKARKNPMHIMELQKVMTAIYLLKQNWAGSKFFRFKAVPPSNRSNLRKVDKMKETQVPVIAMISRGKKEKIIPVSTFQQSIINRKVMQIMGLDELKTQKDRDLYLSHLLDEGYTLLTPRTNLMKKPE